jgi:Uma2 family endonuclease
MEPGGFHMTTAPTSKRRQLTPEEFEALPDHVRYELIDGELRKRNSSSYTSGVAAIINRLLGAVVAPARLGWVTGSDGGVQIFPDRPRKVLIPDVCYISRERLPDGLPKRGWIRVAPELVIEVVSPEDKDSELSEKIRDFLAAGVDLVWVVRPNVRSVTVHHADGVAITISEHGTVTGEHVLPDFSATVASFFPD